MNVLLHAINVALFYFVARRLLTAALEDGAQHERRRLDFCAAAAIAALVFGMHPLRVEPVAWISGRADVLCATFTLVAAWVYLRAVEGGGAAHAGLVLAATVAFMAALLSKGAVLLLPAALVLLDVYPLRRVSGLGWGRLVREKAPLLLVSLAGAAVVGWAVREGVVLNPTWEFGPLARIAVAANSLVGSVARFIWPVALSPLYEMPARISLLDPRFGLAVVVTVIVTALLVLVRLPWPAGLAAWVFSALMLVPTSMALRMGADLAPDRYTYLSGFGFALLMGGAALAAIRLVARGEVSRSVGWAVALAAVVAIGGLAVTSWSLTEVWKESETLWRWALEVDPDCSVCHGKLGETALGGPEGALRAPEAEALFRRAIALRPDLPDAYFNLASALVVQGRPTEAMPQLRSYMERIPIPLLRQELMRHPDAEGVRTQLVEALQRHAGDLRARGHGPEAEVLLAEARTLQSQRPTRP